jgi:hypothetical protein
MRRALFTPSICLQRTPDRVFRSWVDWANLGGQTRSRTCFTLRAAAIALIAHLMCGKAEPAVSLLVCVAIARLLESWLKNVALRQIVLTLPPTMRPTTAMLASVNRETLSPRWQ